MKNILLFAVLIYLAARYIWSAEATTAAIWAACVGALFWWISNLKPSAWQTTSRDATPDVGF
jgi:hypothetical protein